MTLYLLLHDSNGSWSHLLRLDSLKVWSVSLRVCKVTRHCECSGDGANVYFRYMDQSAPAVQAKMLRALDEVLDAEYVSRDVSPATNWLVAFQDFVAQRQPANVTGDGSVTQAAFYDNLEVFLMQQVCPFRKAREAIAMHHLSSQGAEMGGSVLRNIPGDVQNTTY
jgi:hypothetical protein